ncbi:MAG: hypothetical protein ACJA1F_002472 [Paracoccaceae bacterium]|jgi:hypothetical protein
MTVLDKWDTVYVGITSKEKGTPVALLSVSPEILSRRRRATTDQFIF